MQRASSAFSAGLQVQAQCVSHAGINDCVEIRLPPLAAYALFGGAMAEPIANRQVFWTWPRTDQHPPDQLRDDEYVGTSARCRKSISEHGITESTWRIPPELTWAWETLERSHGQVSIGALARAIGWSERHLIDQFRVYFGVRPKATARRLRFSYAFNLVSAHPTWRSQHDRRTSGIQRPESYDPRVPDFLRTQPRRSAYGELRRSSRHSGRCASESLRGQFSSRLAPQSRQMIGV